MSFNKSTKYNYVILTFILVSVLLFSCKTKPKETVNYPIKEINSEAALLASIDSSKHQFHNLNIKFSAKIKTKKNGDNSLRGKLKIRQDSAVWISALPVGIEIARILATQQEAGLIYYLEKSYFKGDYSLLSGLVGYSLNYSMLEAALTGGVFFMQDRNTYKLESDRKIGYFFSPFSKQQFERIITEKETPETGVSNIQALWFNEGNLLLHKNVMYDFSNKRYLEASYEKYTLIGKDYLPQLIRLELKTPEDVAVFTIELNKIEMDVPEMDYPFTIPGSYTLMETKK